MASTPAIGESWWAGSRKCTPAPGMCWCAPNPAPPCSRPETGSSSTKASRRTTSRAPDRPERLVRTGIAMNEVVAPLPASVSPSAPKLIPLLRTLEQVEVALRLGFDEVQLDFMELVGLGMAVEHVRAARARAIVAT